MNNKETIKHAPKKGNKNGARFALAALAAFSYGAMKNEAYAQNANGGADVVEHLGVAPFARNRVEAFDDTHIEQAADMAVRGGMPASYRDEFVAAARIQRDNPGRIISLPRGTRLESMAYHGPRVLGVGERDVLWNGQGDLTGEEMVFEAEGNLVAFLYPRDCWNSSHIATQASESVPVPVSRTEYPTTPSYSEAPMYEAKAGVNINNSFNRGDSNFSINLGDININNGNTRIQSSYEERYERNERSSRRHVRPYRPDRNYVHPGDRVRPRDGRANNRPSGTTSGGEWVNPPSLGGIVTPPPPHGGTWGNGVRSESRYTPERRNGNRSTRGGRGSRSGGFRGMTPPGGIR